MKTSFLKQQTEIEQVEEVVSDKYNQFVGTMNRQERRSKLGKLRIAIAKTLAVQAGVAFLTSKHGYGEDIESN